MQAAIRRESATRLHTISSSFSSSLLSTINTKPPTVIMKLLFHKSIIGTAAAATTTSAAAAALSCCCFLLSSTRQHRTHAWVVPTTSTMIPTRTLVTSSSSSSPLSATVVTDEDAAVVAATKETTAAAAATVDESDKSIIIAEGTVVSTFAGGLTAVRIKDDWLLSRRPLEDNDDSDSEATTATAAATTTLGAETPATTKQQDASKKKNTMGGGDDLLGRNVQFVNGMTGMVVAHRPPLVFVYSNNDNDDDDDDEKVAADHSGPVHVLQSIASVSTSFKNNLVVDAFGQSKEASPLTNDESSTKNSNNSNNHQQGRAIFSPIPQVSDIALINNPRLTGITMVDALAPLGQGQNMLLIGHDAQDMRKYAIDFLQTQLRQGSSSSSKSANDSSSSAKKTTKCVYAAVNEPTQVFDLLEKAGIKDQVHVVVPSDNSDKKDGKDDASRAAEAVAMAGTACALAESYAIDSDTNNGLDTMVIVDTIDFHKKLWDSTTRVLVDVFGVDAVVKDDRDGGASSEMRAFYSSLVQRAGQYKKRKGGGSVTLVLLMTIPRLHVDKDTVFTEADFEETSQKVKERIKLLVQRKIPLTVANLRKIDIPVPSESEAELRLALQHTDDLISMSDGQVWFDEDLVNAGQRPPINPERSITRVGIGADTESRADAPAIRRIAEGLRLDLSQASNMEGAEVTNASKKQIQRKEALLLAMHQESGTGGRLLSESCAVLLAASRGHLDPIVESGATAGTEQGQETMDGLLKHLWKTIPRTMVKVDESLDMTTIQQKQIEDSIKSYLSP